MWRWLSALTRDRSDPSGDERERPQASAIPASSELLEAARKLTRANAKLTLRLEALEKRIDTGFAELRAELASNDKEEKPSERVVDAGAGHVLDALDALDRALEAAEESEASKHMLEGLRLIARRLEDALHESDIERIDDVRRRLPNGRLFRVVGVESHPELLDGVVVRLVRAAARRGEHVVREGDVIVNRIPKTDKTDTRAQIEEASE